jgi:hypothetical protein
MESTGASRGKPERRGGVVINPGSCLQCTGLRISARRHVILSEVCHGSPQSLQENGRVIPRIRP